MTVADIIRKHEKRARVLSRVGQYKGVGWVWKPIGDVLAVPIRARWYFAIVNGQLTGDHFPTLTEFYAWVDR